MNQGNLLVNQVIEHSENKILRKLGCPKTRSDLECSSPAFNKLDRGKISQDP